MKINYKKINKYLIIGFIVLIIVIGLLLYYFKSNKNKQIEIFTNTQELVAPSWNQLGGNIKGKFQRDESGTSVSLSSDGKIVAIGAPYNDNDNGDNSGHVRVYQYDVNKTTANNFGPAGWNQLGEDIIGKKNWDKSGYSVSLSSDGTIVAIVAPDNDYVNGSDSYHVHVYQYNDSQWNQLGEDIIGKADSYRSGFSVSLSSDGTIVAIGAPDNGQGRVRVYQYRTVTKDEWNNSTIVIAINKERTEETYDENTEYWVQLGEDIIGKSRWDYSGYSVSLSSDGTIVAIGAPYNDDNGRESGHVRVYQYNGSSWIQLGDNIKGEAQWDKSGFSVSLSSDGKIVAIGAPGYGGDSGHVRVYQYRTVTKNEWNNNTIVIATNKERTEETYNENTKYWVGKADSDWSGYSVSLSSDGTIVAIGAPYNDDNGRESGHVRVYQYNGSSWIQLGDNIKGEAQWDNSGYSVSLSSDGKIVAIGSPFNDGDNDNNIYDSGCVRVYKYITENDLTKIKLTDDYETNKYIIGVLSSDKIFDANITKQNIKEVIIGNSVTSIDMLAFDSSNLTSIEIPDSVTSIGLSAFYECNELTSITFDENIVLESIQFNTFLNCSSLTSITIPNSVTSIGSSSFNGCTELTSIIFNENSVLESIGDSAFMNCSSLTFITIPDNVKSIGNTAFHGCSSLTSIIIPSSVTSIGDSAFMNCSSLTYIIFNGTGNDRDIILGIDKSFNNINSFFNSKGEKLEDKILVNKLNIPSEGVTFTHKPSTTQPSTTKPSTTHPSTTQPSTTQPSTTQPSTTQPHTTSPETTQPSTTQPKIVSQQPKKQVIQTKTFPINSNETIEIPDYLYLKLEEAQNEKEKMKKYLNSESKQNLQIKQIKSRIE